MAHILKKITIWGNNFKKSYILLEYVTATTSFNRKWNKYSVIDSNIRQIMIN